MSFIRKLTAAVITALIAAGTIFPAAAEAANTINRMYSRKYDLTVNMLKSDEETMEAAKEFGRYVIFFSVSDGKSKAKVFLSQSYTLDTALKNSYDKAKASGIVPKWFKLDIVISDEEKSYEDFVTETESIRVCGMRNGIAFNSYYGTAILEAQLNSSGIIDYEAGGLDLQKLNKELGRMGKKKLSAVPDTLRLFTTQGYFAENTAEAYKCVNGTYNETGRRKISADRAAVEMLADRTSSYFASIADKNGKFAYGYYPIDNEEIEGYNILRHTGTVWNLIMLYDMCRDESLVPLIKSSLGYLDKFIQYRDKKTAFVRDGNSLNVGGNGLALLAYTTYEEVFCTGEYYSKIRALANGILKMQKSDGSFIHTVNKDTYKTERDYVIIYYDGEAAYGLIKAYGVLGDAKYIDASVKAADYFVENDYSGEHSHWMSYVFNEITKYRPYERYFEFGLKNVNTDDFSKNMYLVKSGSNSVSETLNASLELYDRLIKGGYTCDYLEEFDALMLVKAVIKRAKYGMNYFMFPEYAMYFTAPETVLNSFSVREDNFRIRIDDIQHFMDGYYLYWKNYDMITQYNKTLSESNKETAAA